VAGQHRRIRAAAEAVAGSGAGSSGSVSLPTLSGASSAATSPSSSAAVAGAGAGAGAAGVGALSLPVRLPMSTAAVLSAPPAVEALCTALRSYGAAADACAGLLRRHPASVLPEAAHLIVPETQAILTGGVRVADVRRRHLWLRLKRAQEEATALARAEKARLAALAAGDREGLLALPASAGAGVGPIVRIAGGGGSASATGGSRSGAGVGGGRSDEGGSWGSGSRRGQGARCGARMRVRGRGQGAAASTLRRRGAAARPDARSGVADAEAALLLGREGVGQHRRPVLVEPGEQGVELAGPAGGGCVPVRRPRRRCGVDRRHRRTPAPVFLQL